MMLYKYNQYLTRATQLLKRALPKLALSPLIVVLSISSQADVLFHNFNGYRFVEDQATQEIQSERVTPAPKPGYWQLFSAMLIGQDGRIKKIYDAASPMPRDLQKTDIKTVDMQGRTILPGLIDAHGHVISLGQRHQRVDLVGGKSLAEAQKSVADFAQKDQDSPWLLGRGWNQVLWPGKQFPTATDLDEIEADRPVFLNRIDGHAAWANSAALKAAGITTLSEDPQGGQIIRLSDGSPSGVLVDSAMNLVQEVIPPASLESLSQALDLAQQEMASLGLTMAHDAGITHQEALLFKDKAENNQLSVRFYGMVSGAGEHLTAVAKPWQETHRDFFTLRSVKLYADGALGSRGAALIEPYSDQANHFGLLFSPFDQLKLQIKRAVDLGFQVNTHAIGDAANRQVLDIFEELEDPQTERRHRIEHAQVIALDDIERFAKLNMIASMQPVHATSDMNMAEDRIGSQRIAGAYAWRSLLNAGVRLAGGSDFPVELANPFHGLYAAVSRKDQNGNPRSGWYADQALTRGEALRSFTVDAAYAAHQEDRLGNLDKGFWADFIVLDQDYFQIPTDQIWNLKVAETWVAGDCIYQSK